MKSIRLLVVCLLCISATVLPLWGQAYQGGLRGRVTDQSDALVANAQVRIIDQATNVSRATLTNTDGEYVFSSVNPATYTLICENPGFKRFERTVIIGTQQFITLDVRLEVGAVTETVQITEEVPLMETSTASEGALLDHQKLYDLPNIGRNPFIMAWVAPNVIPAGDPRFVRFQDQSGSSQVSFAGGPQRGNVYLIDGTPVTDGINRAVIIPSLEAVQEMKIQTNTYDAELGRYAGGVYNMFLRSGTNDIHGSVFGIFRRQQFFANDFFANRAGEPRPDTPYDNWGASLGGPIYVPKIYNGKNRTFWWLATEGYRQITSQFTTLVYPTAAEASGDFSNSRTQSGQLVTIYDPKSGQVAGGQFTRTPFQNNRIPADQINRIGFNLLHQVPNPNAQYYGAANYAAHAELHDQAREATGKVDHEFFKWWRANLSYLHYSSREPGPDWLGTGATPGAWVLDRWANITVTNHTFIPNPTTIVNIRYGYVNFPNRQKEVGYGVDPAFLGFPTSFTHSYPVGGQRYPAFDFSQGFTGQGCNGCTVGDTPASKSFYATFSKFLGRHSVKAGFQHRVINWDHLGENGPGEFSFDERFTAADPSNPGNTGSAIASALLGLPAGGSTSIESLFQGTFKYFAGFFHDDFRLSPRITLNLGLRYEFEQGYRDRNNRLVVGFDRRAVNPIGAQLPAGSGVLPLGGLLYAGVDGAKIYYGDPSFVRFAPRLGIAWQIGAKTTIRGGYGTLYAPPVYAAQTAPGYARNTDLFATADNYRTAAGSLSNPYPNGLLQPAGNALRLKTGLGGSIGFWNPDMHSGGFVHQFSVDVQRTLPGNINGSITYQGSRSRHIQQNAYSLNINQLDPSFFSLGDAYLTESVANPFFGLEGSPGFFAGKTTTRSQLLRPFPQFTSVGMAGVDLARARYDAVTFRIEKRMSAGLTFLSHMTISKTYDMSAASTFFNQSNPSIVQDNYNYGAEYSLAMFHVPRRFVTTLSYELPFGRGKHFGPNVHPAVNHVISGWQLNIITSYQAGFPLAVAPQSNLNAPFGAGQRPNATGTSPEIPGKPQDKLDHYLRADAFSNPPEFAFGNLARVIPDRGPGQANWDVSLFKSVSVKERLKMQFRAESINFTNTPRFYAPANLSVGSGSFATITQQANFPRFVQLGARFIW